MAQKFVAQMGSISDDFAAYLDKWSMPENISEEAAAFRADTRAILNRLEARIEQENEELYPLADKLL